MDLDGDRKGLIIVDLDGTVYDTTNRITMVNEGRWDDFHKASVNDEPNYDVLEALRALAPNYFLLGCTGRNEKYRGITADWLLKHDLPLDDLLMRGDDDFRSDTEMKWGLISEWVQSNSYNISHVDFALEDRDKMVDFWRGKGIPCWQVRPSGY